MPRYAVKVGEAVLKSDKPITGEEREKAKRVLHKYVLHLDGELEIHFSLAVDGH